MPTKVHLVTAMVFPVVTYGCESWTIKKAAANVFSCARLFVTPWTAAHEASLSFTVSESLLTFMSIESMTPSSHLILCHPFFLVPSVFPSIGVFSNEWTLLIGWPKYWSFNSPSNEYSGLISFRIYWFDLLIAQWILKHLLQHHNSKHQFFSAQASLWSNSHSCT